MLLNAGSRKIQKSEKDRVFENGHKLVRRYAVNQLWEMIVRGEFVVNSVKYWKLVPESQEQAKYHHILKIQKGDELRFILDVP